MVLICWHFSFVCVQVVHIEVGSSIINCNING